MHRRHLLSLALGAGLALAASLGQAQSLGVGQNPVLVVDPNRLFAETEFGRRVARELEEESAALAAENRRIESELTAEEKALTEARAELSSADFRLKADAFDEKVQRIRKEQEDKAIALAGESDAAQRRFLSVARPVLEELMRESGAAVLLDTRAVLLSSGAADVTEEAVGRIDEVIGDGANVATPAPEDTAPDDPAPEETAPQE